MVMVQNMELTYGLLVEIVTEPPAGRVKVDCTQKVRAGRGVVDGVFEEEGVFEEDGREPGEGDGVTAGSPAASKTSITKPEATVELSEVNRRVTSLPDERSSKGLREPL